MFCGHYVFLAETGLERRKASHASQNQITTGVVRPTSAVVFAVFVLVGGGVVGVSVRAIVGSGVAFSVVGGVVRLGVRSAWRRWLVVAQAHIRGAQSDPSVAIRVAPSTRRGRADAPAVLDFARCFLRMRRFGRPFGMRRCGGGVMSGFCLAGRRNAATLAHV